MLRRLLPVALLLLTACGKNRDLPPSGPIDPAVYEIAEDDRPTEGQWLRYVAPGPKGGGLDVAIVDFAREAGGPTVHLVGVVHVADAPYYERLQTVLDGYDVVLFEGILEAASIGGEWQREMLERGGEAGNMQMEIAAWFGFRFQMEALDYARPSFVHADMTMEEFREQGGAKLGLVPDEDDEGDERLPRGLSDAWKKISAFGRAVLGVPGPLQSLARRTFAEALGTADIGDIGDAMGFAPGMKELVLTKRNALVMQRLDDQLERRAEGSIAIFYGAAHNDDLAKQLATRGYERTGGRWLRAWGLRPVKR